MAESSWTGKTIGKYRLVEQIGRGGMAEVFKAYQPGLDRYVAVKLMHSFLADDKDFMARFQREAKLVASLRHPNIVQVHDFDVEGGVSYMVMEYVDGETLKSRLQNLEEKGQWISLDEAVRIILSVGSALKYAHRLGMVHRDVKPANVMINKNGDVILTDFGIAKIFAGSGGTQLTASGAMVGTPSYMSPEQGLGQPGDERSDIYSLGVMLYQLVTARLPFEADTPLAVVLKHVNEPPPPPRTLNPDVPESIEAIILKALAKNPDDRYQHVGDMLNDLRRAVGMTLDEVTPTDTMRARVLPAGASGAGTGVITPLPAGARTVAARPPAPTTVAAPSYPARRTGVSGWVVALGVLAVLLVIVIGVAAAMALKGQVGIRTPTAAVVSSPTSTPTVPPATPTPPVFKGTVKGDTAAVYPSPTNSVAPIGGLPPGTLLIVRARSADNAWLRVETTDGTVAGWVSTDSVDLGGTLLSAIPQAALVGAPTPTPNLTATAAACKPHAQVSDVTVPDGTQFKPGEAFIKTWRFTSSGNCKWENGTTLTFQSGEKFGAPDSVPVEAVEVGKSVEVSVDMKAPTAYGTYTGVWALKRPSGQVITTTDVSIVVPAPTPTRGAVPPTSPPAAAPTATSTPSVGPGPVGAPGPLQASWNGGFGNGVAVKKTDPDGGEHWECEGDFYIDVYGGNAGYTISSPACRWSNADQKFVCHWGARDGTTISQSVIVSCPGCRPVKVDIVTGIERKGTVCYLK